MSQQPPCPLEVFSNKNYGDKPQDIEFINCIRNSMNSKLI